jgi:adenylate kinase family enzyme
MKILSNKQEGELRRWLGSGSINIFGLPFSGKDTHGGELAKFFDCEVIGGGDILRSKSGPEHLKAHIANGSLAPSDEYLALVIPYFSQKKYDGQPLILSTVGRWDGEQQSVIEGAENSGHPLKAVVLLNVAEEESIRRWEKAERGRQDDAGRHILENRFKEYRDKTMPVIELGTCYRRRWHASQGRSYS